MKLKRVLAVPFAIVADAATLGNFGDRSFTQQVFDAERREQRFNQEKEALDLLVKIIRAAKE